MPVAGAAIDYLIDRITVRTNALPARVAAVLREEADAAVVRMREHYVPWPGGERPWERRPPFKLFRRSGGHQESLRHTPVVTSATESSTTFSMTGPGATTQEQGRFFSSSRGFMLIPGGAQLDSRGVRRFGHVRGGFFYHLRTVRIPARPVVHPEVEVAAERVAQRLGGLITERV